MPATSARRSRASIHVRNRINEGKIPGRRCMSGPFIQHVHAPGTELFRWGVKGPDDARAKVQKLADGGVDVIKLIDRDQMTIDEVQAVVDEAHRRGKPVVAHAHRPEEIRRGLAAGVDCFEHTDLASSPEYPEDIIALLRERTANMARGPLFWTPTIEGLFNYEYVRDNPEHLDDPAWQNGLPPDIVADIKRSIQHPGQMSYFRPRRPVVRRFPGSSSSSRSRGVTLLIGTDSGIPMKFSSSTWRELDAWVNLLGVDPMTAIRGATCRQSR